MISRRKCSGRPVAPRQGTRPCRVGFTPPSSQSTQSRRGKPRPANYDDAHSPISKEENARHEFVVYENKSWQRPCRGHPARVVGANSMAGPRRSSRHEMQNSPPQGRPASPYAKRRKMKALTGMTRTTIIRLAGETEAGSAEVQPIRLRLRAGPARDSRTRATNVVGMAGPNLPSHLPNDHSKPLYSLRKPVTQRTDKELFGKRICPFHAEPIHTPIVNRKSKLENRRVAATMAMGGSHWSEAQVAGRVV
jgi:hypothetical protein